MAVDRPDRVECILDQGFVVLGGGLQGVRISEEAAGFLRDACLSIIQEQVQANQWTPGVANTVWDVVSAIGAEARVGHTAPYELTVDDIVQAIWKVIKERSSFICLKLKQALTKLGFPQPLV